MRYVVQCGPNIRRNVDAMYDEIPELEEMHRTTTTEDYARIMDCEVAMADFIDCLKVEGSHVHFEDDVILCKGFKEKAEGIIAQAPYDVIWFFSRPKHKDGGWIMNPGWAQCIYFPEWFKRGAVRHFEAVWWHSDYNRKHDRTAYDYVIGSYMQKMGYKAWVCVPSLVQHAIGPSALGNRPHDRPAGLFVDDMEDPDSVTWVVGE